MLNEQAVANSVIELVSSQPFLQEWPDYSQVLVKHLCGEPAWNLALPSLCCQAIGGEPDSAIPIAAAWSTLHFSALIFDALQDGHELPAELGTAANAINIASALMFTAYRLIGTIPDPEVVKRATSIFSKAGFQAALGQHYDSSQAGKRRAGREGLEHYWQTVIYKSGSVFEAAAAAGAAVGTSSWDGINSFRAYGTALGVMLQVIDDCRDILLPGQDRTTGMVETSLPLLLYQSTIVKHNGQPRRLQEIPDDRQELFELLHGENIPQVIVRTLQEWRRRALDSLEKLDDTEAKARLEVILDVGWEANIKDLADMEAK